MRVVRTREELTRELTGSDVLVPTMGALHEGHLSLFDLAKEHTTGDGRVVVSLFVNPTQFDEAADLDRYPRTFEADAAGCEEHGVDVLWVPGVRDVYPEGVGAAGPELPEQAIGKGLEDASRPGHFRGVVQVVNLLFEAARPASAVFGEKDWQQLAVLQAMARDRFPGLRVIPGPTVREPDGLAMSSRNRFIPADQRDGARGLHRSLVACSAIADPVEAERALCEGLRASGLSIEYAAVRDADKLGPYEPGRPGRALAAVRLDAGNGESVRLLDNVEWPGSEPG
ncbi:MAG: pantoate--beta-alanine ligase [Planctomycetota bacterium]